MNDAQTIQAFSKIINCEKCNSQTASFLLRDRQKNLPQPGYIGSKYQRTRLLLIGQNPGICPPPMIVEDTKYMRALLDLAKYPTQDNYQTLYGILLNFIPSWPVQRNHFPLQALGLGLEDIAYCNVIRCRTENNKKPNKNLTQNCIEEHLLSFIDLVDPSVIVFIGKWAHDQISPFLKSKCIPMTFMNRDRSLSREKRAANRKAVIGMVLDLIKKEN
ncbi:MAG: hypothetical protein GX625_05555 [Clostridiaceae bacterium]|nr:hypothetical protein [Clostridiaceae bacterium]